MLPDIEWLIVGGESGAGWRPMDKVWATDLRDRCLEQDVKFFYKQDNGVRSGMNPYLDGQAHKEWPDTFFTEKQIKQRMSLPLV